jgi:hypothetical protein
MKCTDVRSRFSARFDGELSAEALQTFEDHCAGCAACATDWWDFLRSTRALREVGVRPVSDEYVDSLVASVLAAEGQRRGGAPPLLAALRNARVAPVLSHASALLAGAALVLLFLWLVGPPAEEAGIAQSAPPAQGEAIDIELVQPQPSEPRVEIVERIVEKIVEKYVPLATPCTRPHGGEALARSVTFFGDAFLKLRDALEEDAARLVATGGAPVPELRAPREPTPEVEHAEPGPGRVPPELDPRRFAIAEDVSATVVVQRWGEVLSLETRGSLDEVVPALIARIGDEDPKVSDMVQLRLLDIWTERTGRSAVEAPGVARKEERLAHVGWQRWFPGDSQPEGPRDPAGEWSAWWRAEQGVIALAGF